MKSNRRGVAAVEFALVLPCFLLLLLGVLEIGRAIHIQQTIVNASREGARLAATKAAESDVKSTVLDYLTKAKVPTSAVSVKQSRDRDAMTVEVDLPYSAVSWLPPTMLAGRTLSASSTFRRE